MKSEIDLAVGLAEKARKDLLAMTATRKVGALEASCFHAQQAAEKALKALLTSMNQEFPYTHNSQTLVELVSAIDPRFRRFLDAGETLTPYAVEVRYNVKFTPTKADAAKAARLGQAICRLAFSLLPPAARPPK